MSAIAIKHPD